MHSVTHVIHVLMHADDLILTASSRSLAISKLKHLISYCKRNLIKLGPSKSNFIVINGSNEDMNDLNVDGNLISHCSHLSLLGSHLSESGCLRDDLVHHLEKRYLTCIKFYNFVKTNRCAPIFVKLKVLKSCVMSNLLYNCETFGKENTKEIEICYFKMLKTALGIRSNVPNDIVLIESGFLPVKALIYSRQLNFFRKFRSSLRNMSSRSKVFRALVEQAPNYLQHYIDLDTRYNNSNEIVFEHLCKIKDKIRNLSRDDNHYRYRMYMIHNPELKPSKFIHCIKHISSVITKFRLGSHLLPIETGRWCRKPREARLCLTCKVLGDERHLLYDCIEVDRSGLNLPDNISDLWKCDSIFELFNRIDRLRKFF